MCWYVRLGGELLWLVGFDWLMWVVMCRLFGIVELDVVIFCCD